MAIGTPSSLAGPTWNSGVVNSRASSSYTPTVGNVLLACIVSQSNTDPGGLTAAAGLELISTTHAGLTWTPVITNGVVFDPSGASYYARMIVYWATCPASPGSGTTTFTFNDGSAPENIQRNQTIYNIISISGVDPYNPIVQSKSNTGTTATSLTATLDATPKPDSIVVGFCAVAYGASGTDTNIGVPTNHTELSETNGTDASYNDQLVVSYDIAGAGTSLNFTNFPTTGTATSGSAIIGVELRALNKGIPPALMMAG